MSGEDHSFATACLRQLLRSPSAVKATALPSEVATASPSNRTAGKVKGTFKGTCVSCKHKQVEICKLREILPKSLAEH